MNIEIRKLTPELLEDYLNFFDTTPHFTNKDEDKCYCVCWSNVACEEQEFSTVEKRRNKAITYVKNNNIQGYLAYYNNKVVGWCNANTKSDCMECQCGKMYLSLTDKEESSPNIKVKGVFCFAIAPEMRGNGIATLLLKCVCEDAALDGFDFVEAYPNKEFISAKDDYMGPIKIYENLGFTAYYEIGPKLVMRKKLK